MSAAATARRALKIGTPKAGSPGSKSGKTGEFSPQGKKARDKYFEHKKKQLHVDGPLNQLQKRMRSSDA